MTTNPGRSWGERQDQYQDSWTNRDILTDHERIIREQDQMLGHLDDSVSALKHTSVDMNLETTEQIALLDRIDGKIDNNQVRITNASRQTENVTIKSSTKLLWLVIILLFITMIILMIFALKK